jgi:hypothetical protein
VCTSSGHAGLVSSLPGSASDLASFKLSPTSSGLGLAPVRGLRLLDVDVGDERWGVLAEVPALEVLEVG